MNARSHVFEISVEPRQMEEALLSIFHSVMFHRTMGKFHYNNESSYTIGNLGKTLGVLGVEFCSIVFSVEFSLAYFSYIFVVITLVK